MCEDPEGAWSPGGVISYCIVVEGTLFPEEKKQQVFTDFELGYVIRYLKTNNGSILLKVKIISNNVERLRYFIMNGQKMSIVVSMSCW